jgi:hypothetical protein
VLQVEEEPLHPFIDEKEEGPLHPFIDEKEEGPLHPFIDVGRPPVAPVLCCQLIICRRGVSEGLV